MTIALSLFDVFSLASVEFHTMVYQRDYQRENQCENQRWSKVAIKFPKRLRLTEADAALSSAYSHRNQGRNSESARSARRANHFLRQFPSQLRWRCSKAIEGTGGLCAVMAGLVLFGV